MMEDKINRNTVEIPYEDFQFLTHAATQLQDIRTLVSTDPKDHDCLHKQTQDALDALLGINRENLRKEKTA